MAITSWVSLMAIVKLSSPQQKKKPASSASLKQKILASFLVRLNPTFGGAQEIRTPHLFHAMEALYQMS